MKISEFFRQPSVQATKSAGEVSEDRVQKRALEHQVANSGEDKVSISPEARQFAQISKLLSEDENQRSLRVEELKAQVANGSYSVPLRDVAKSIVDTVNDSDVV